MTYRLPNSRKSNFATELLDYHDATLVREGFSPSPPFSQGSRSTPLEHLPMFLSSESYPLTEPEVRPAT